MKNLRGNRQCIDFCHCVYLLVYPDSEFWTLYKFGRIPLIIMLLRVRTVENITDIYPCHERVSNPQSPCSSDPWPSFAYRGHWIEILSSMKLRAFKDFYTAGSNNACCSMELETAEQLLLYSLYLCTVTHACHWCKVLQIGILAPGFLAVSSTIRMWDILIGFLNERALVKISLRWHMVLYPKCFSLKSKALLLN
jgi:hypothetical protein